MHKQALNLSKLADFIVNTLNSTEEVKKILQLQCEEAKLVLAPWPLETVTRKDITEVSCTCVGVVSAEEHVKEIASGIDRAVAQARQLREKLAINVLEEKKIARRPSVQQIYSSGSKNTDGKIKTVDSSKLGKENGGKKEGVIMNGGNATLKKDSRTLNTTKKLKTDAKSTANTGQSRSNGGKTSEAKKIIDKKLVVPSPYNSLVSTFKVQQKFKGTKNFIAANKSNVKNMKTTNSKATVESKNHPSSSQSSAATKSSESLISQAATSAEFENLISKISLEPENGLMKSTANVTDNNGCLVHDLNAPRFIEEKIYTSVDVAEGLDRFGVPPELVKILKVYHSYLNSEVINESSDKRSGRATRRFLEEFETMNRERRKTSSREKLDNLCEDFLPVLKESCDKSNDFVQLSRLKIRYTHLDSICKTLKIRSFSPTKRKLSNMIENRYMKSFYESNITWRSNAVWNEAYVSSLNAMSSVRCIRYSNKTQLLALSEFMQKIQQLKYQQILLDLLTNEVVPSVHDCLEPMSEEYIDAFKMISTISNLYGLRVPVLVRTDK